MDVGVDQISQLLPDVPLYKICNVLKEKNGDIQSALDCLLESISDGETEHVSESMNKSTQAHIRNEETEVLQLYEMFEHVPPAILRLVYRNHTDLDSALEYLVNSDTEDTNRLKIIIEAETELMQHSLWNFASKSVNTTNVWDRRAETVKFLVELLGSPQKQVSTVVARERGSLELSIRQLLLTGGSPKSEAAYSNTLVVIELYRQFHPELYLVDDTMLKLLVQRLAPAVVKILIALYAIVNGLDQVDPTPITPFPSLHAEQQGVTEHKNTIPTLRYAEAAHQSFSGVSNANATTKPHKVNDRIRLQRHCASLAGRISTSKDPQIRQHYNTEYSNARKLLCQHREQLQQQLVSQRTQAASQTLDLHGLTVPMATKAVQTALNRWWDQEIHLREWKGVHYKLAGPVQHMEPLRLITGRGMHSAGGFSRIRKCLIKELEAFWILDRDNPGELIVIGRKSGTANR